MKILEHISLTTTKVQQQYKRVKEALAQGDFAAAQAKKLRNAPFYRAKLGDAHRLLFKIGSHQGEGVVLILEVILNHDYKGSRFLRGADIHEQDFSGPDLDKMPEADDQLRYLNPKSTTFHLIDKPISFNPEQEDIFLAPMPLILIGSAGSGKTVLTLEKLRLLPGRVLYISLSAFLVENARRLFSLASKEDEGDVDFLSFRELLGMIQIPSGREVRYSDFASWCALQSGWAKQNSRKLFEEFRGVLSGGGKSDGGPLSQDEYLQLGIKQSIFLDENRSQVFELFRRYRAWLPQSRLYDSTILAHEYIQRARPTYDSVIVDEVQDFTVPQLALILRMMKQSHHFMLCGDSNQIVHPNFFSWSRVKSFFFAQDDDLGSRIIRVLRTNFRNARKITAVANTLLALKQRRFGSIDKESNFLVESIADDEGSIAVVNARSSGVDKLNEASRISTKFAIIVLDDADKGRARSVFDTPLIFSVHEAKGLEYPNVILYSFVTSAQSEFKQIVGDITSEELTGDISFARNRDKTDKSLEIYKFYVNALYVGITRALSTVYVVDEAADHPLWELLSIPRAAADLSISDQSSSAEEWSKEAHRLELQGKLEQARDIREKILKIEKVPWSLPTAQSLHDGIALADNKSLEIQKKQLIELFEIAEAQDLPSLIEYVNNRSNAPTRDVTRAKALMAEKYYGQYTTSNPRGLRAAIRRYGVDHRNQLGETPLLIAAKLWKPRLVEELLQEGANPQICTYGGLSPLRAVLREIFTHPKLTRRQAEEAGETWRLLAEPILLNIEGRLIKLLPHQGEYMLFQVLATIFTSVLQDDWILFQAGIEIAHIFSYIEKLPHTILSEKRRNHQYFSALFSKNEVARYESSSRALLFRVNRGKYLFNPLIKMMHLSVEADHIGANSQINEMPSDIEQPDPSTAPSQGIPLYDVLGFPFLPEPDERYLRRYPHIPIRQLLDEMTTQARNRMQPPSASGKTGTKRVGKSVD